jgi:hypothetical protein
MTLCYVIWSTIMWKSVKLKFCQFSLNLTHCATTESNPGTLDPFPHYRRSNRPQQHGIQLLYMKTDLGTQPIL